MDPFLEVPVLWETVHGWFIRKLAEHALPEAQSLGCWIGVERSVYQREPSGELTLIGEPDALSWADFAAVSPLAASSGGGLAVAEPLAVHEVVLSPEEQQLYKQDYLVVRELGRTSRVLAVLELLSAANKERSGYGPVYREKRMRLLTSRTHFMEIDLLRGGLNLSRDKFPELAPAPYFVFVARKTSVGRQEGGRTVTLQERLPVVALPAFPGGPDLHLNLQAAFDAAFEMSVPPGLIDYRHLSVPPPSLTPDDAEFVRGVVAAIRA